MSAARGDRRTRVGRRALVAVAALAAIGAVAWSARSDAPPPPQGEITIATGRSGGLARVYGEAFARALGDRMPRLRVRSRASGGSVENLDLLASGQADVAVVRADATARRPNLERSIGVLATLYDSYIQLFVLGASPIRTFEDLARACRDPSGSPRRCRVAIGTSKAGTSVAAKRMLAAARLHRAVSIEPTDDLDRLVRGELDAMFWSAGLPTPAIQELQRLGERPRLIDLGAPAKLLVAAHPNLYARATIATDPYGSGPPIRTAAVAVQLVAPHRLSDAIVYAVTAALYDVRPELKRAHPEGAYLRRGSAIDTYPFEQHRGARRYYREQAR